MRLSPPMRCSAFVLSGVFGFGLANHAKSEEPNESYAVTSTNMPPLSALLKAKSISDSTKTAIEEIIRRKAAIEQVGMKRAQAEAKKLAIGQEQARIRQNIPTIDKNSDLYRRYVKKFTDQETDLEKLEAEIQSLNDAQSEQTSELEKHVLGLTLE